jgi:hypothetical protein
MALGDVTNTVHFATCENTFATDTIKRYFISNSVTPSKNDSDPRWGAGGAQDYSTAALSGGNFPSGGTAWAGQSVSQTNNVKSFLATSPIINYASNASNPTGVFWAIDVNVTQSNKVIRFVDMGGSTSLVTGLQMNLNSVGSGSQNASTITNN